jgi:hypothetical protein
MAKPLMSRLLVKKVDNQSSHEEADDTPVERASQRCSEAQTLGSEVLWKTPTGTQNMAGQLQQLDRLIDAGPTARLLFRKVQKAYEAKSLDLATATIKNKRQESELETLRGVKRKRVQSSANRLFVEMRNVRAARGERIEVSSESPDSDDSSVILECITIS